MKEEGSNRTKKQSCQPLADCPARQGGRSARAVWTVPQGIADCPHPCRGPSGLSPGLSEKDSRTTRDAPRITDRPRGARGLSAKAPADCPPSTRGPSETSSNQNSKPQQIETKGEQEHELHPTNTRGADRPPGRHGLSARHGQSRKTARPRRSTPPNHHWISQTVEAVETKVWGLEKRHTRML
jgi:hypothetical protein